LGLVRVGWMWMCCCWFLGMVLMMECSFFSYCSSGCCGVVELAGFFFLFVSFFVWYQVPLSSGGEMDVFCRVPWMGRTSRWRTAFPNLRCSRPWESGSWGAGPGWPANPCRTLATGGLGRREMPGPVSAVSASVSAEARRLDGFSEASVCVVDAGTDWPRDEMVRFSVIARSSRVRATRRVGGAGSGFGRGSCDAPR